MILTFIQGEISSLPVATESPSISKVTSTDSVIEELPEAAKVLFTEMQQEIRRLQLQLKDLRNQMWGSKSERTHGNGAAGTIDLFYGEIPGVSSEVTDDIQPSSPVTVSTPASTSSVPVRNVSTKGPKPLDPKLPREFIKLDDPEPSLRICPLTGVAMKPGFTERLEVLARRKPEYYVQAYERTVWTAPSKCTPVYAEWPNTVWGKSRVHVSIVSHLATAHYADHMPFYRIEQQLKRLGVAMPRNTQVSLMSKLDQTMSPMVDYIKRTVLSSGYVHLDATPIDVLDPARPKRAQEACIWAYRSRNDINNAANGNASNLVFFDYRHSKSPDHPNELLRQVNYRGVLQTDGASGLGQIGPPGQITHLGCWAHARRYFHKAVDAGELTAGPYLQYINRLFEIERRAVKHALAPEQYASWRTRYSVPIITEIFTRAQADQITAQPKTLFKKAITYLVNQREPLTRCITTQGEGWVSRIDNNPVENSVRPIKLGAKNYLFVGHPDAGPRLTNLYTIIENCRAADVDPEAYLTDIVPRIAAYIGDRVALLLPSAWKETQKALNAQANTAENVG